MKDDEKYISINVKEYVKTEVNHLEEKMNLNFEKNHDALTEAKEVMNRRLQGMNEFREQLNCQTKTFISRDEFSASEKLINHKIDSISRLVYIGVGILLVVQVVIGLLIDLTAKK